MAAVLHEGKLVEFGPPGECFRGHRFSGIWIMRKSQGGLWMWRCGVCCHYFITSSVLIHLAIIETNEFFGWFTHILIGWQGYGSRQATGACSYHGPLLSFIPKIRYPQSQYLCISNAIAYGKSTNGKLICSMICSKTARTFSSSNLRPTSWSEIGRPLKNSGSSILH